MAANLPLTHLPEPLNAQLAQVAVRAIRYVVAPHGPWPKQSQAFLADLRQRLAVEVDFDLEPELPEPEQLADPGLRVQVVRVAIVATLLQARPTRETAARLRALEDRLASGVPEVRNLELLAARRRIAFRIHLMRRFWAVRMFGERLRSRGLTELVRQFFPVLRLWRNGALVNRYEQLRALPAESLGRAYLEFLEQNQFSIHGERGALPELIIHHDLSHVLAGYGTSPAHEVGAACFQAGYRERDPFVFVVFVLYQFQLGLRMTPAGPGKWWSFDPGTAMDAIARGARMNRDLTDGTWDYWADFPLPIDAVRQRYALPPA